MEQFDLMVEIITNNNFLSLRRNLATPLSLFHQKRTEKKKKKFSIKTDFFNV
jgi:hypothetical protein